MIETAILLAAGEGSRLRPAAPFKPLCPVAGRSLLAHAIARAGRGRAHAGGRRARLRRGEIEAHLAAQAWPLAVETARVEDYRKPNGTSVLAAEPHVAGGEALLAMCDHLVDPELYRRMARGRRGCRRAAGDRPAHRDSDWVDLDDVTRVRTDRRADRRRSARGSSPTTASIPAFRHRPGAVCRACRLEAPSLTEGMRVLARAAPRWSPIAAISTGSTSTTPGARKGGALAQHGDLNGRASRSHRAAKRRPCR